MNRRYSLASPDQSNTKVLVSMEEAALLLSVGRTMVYHLVLSGELRCVKVGRMRRVVVASLHEYVARLMARAS